MEIERSRKRRRYNAELKAKILSECDAPNASVAKVAMSHGIDANIVYGWRKLARRTAVPVDNWLFAGSLRAGKRAAAIMSLVHSARLNGHDPYAYLRETLERLPTQPASWIAELLPHRWNSAAT